MSARTAGNLPSPEPDAPSAGAGPRTPDLGGSASTTQVGEALAALVAGGI